MTTAIINARLIDPATDYDGPGGVAFEDGVITAAGPDLAKTPPNSATEVIDAAGAVLAPALVDLLAGLTPQEDLAALRGMAAAGGVGTVLVQPVERGWDDDADEAMGPAVLRASPLMIAGSLAPLHSTGARRAKALTLGAQPPADARTLLRALTYAAPFERPIFMPVGDAVLDSGALLGEGGTAALLGLTEAVGEAEAIGLHRNAILAAKAGVAAIHGPVTTAAALQEADLRAAAGDAPPRMITDFAHLLFNDVDVGGLDADYRVSPVLRAETDRAALMQAVAAGRIMIGSSHRAVLSNRGDTYEEADVGGDMLQFALAALLSLHFDHGLTLLRLFKAAALDPADAIAAPSGRLTEGAPADMVLFDPDAPAPKRTAVRSPFAKRRLQGRIVRLILNGADERTERG